MNFNFNAPDLGNLEEEYNDYDNFTQYPAVPYTSSFAEPVTPYHGHTPTIDQPLAVTEPPTLPLQTPASTSYTDPGWTSSHWTLSPDLNLSGDFSGNEYTDADIAYPGESFSNSGVQYAGEDVNPSYYTPIYLQGSASPSSPSPSPNGFPYGSSTSDNFHLAPSLIGHRDTPVINESAATSPETCASPFVYFLVLFLTKRVGQSKRGRSRASTATRNIQTRKPKTGMRWRCTKNREAGKTSPVGTGASAVGTSATTGSRTTTATSRRARTTRRRWRLTIANVASRRAMKKSMRSITRSAVKAGAE